MLKVYSKFLNGGNELHTYINTRTGAESVSNTRTLTQYKSSVIALLTVSEISSGMYVDDGLFVIRFLSLLSWVNISFDLG